MRATHAALDAWSRVTLASIGDAVLTTDTEGRVTFVNRVAVELTGWSPDAAVGRPVDEVFRIVEEATRRPVESPVARVLREGVVVGLANHTVLVARDGRDIPVDDSGAPIVDERGAVIGVVLVFHDVSERRRLQHELAALLSREHAARVSAEAAERRAEFLDEATTLLSSSLDYETTLGTLSRLAVPRLADLCAVDMVDEQGELRRLAVSHVDPEKADLARRMRDRHGFAASSLTLEAVRSGKAQFVPQVTEAHLAAASHGPEHLAMYRALGVSSAIVVPLAARGRVLGVITLVTSESGRRYDHGDLALAQDLAYRAALAVDNAKLLREAERRRREAEILTELVRSINAATELDTILKRVAEGGRELCGSDLCAIALRDAESGEMVFRYRAGTLYRSDGRFVAVPGRGVGGLVLVSGRPERSADIQADPRLDPDATYVAAVTEERLVSAMAVPIRLEGSIEGLLYVNNRTARSFTDHDEAVLVQLADHAAVAITNARVLADARTARTMAEAASRAKDEFLATMSHELRTPLTSILGWSRMLGTGTLDSASSARALDAIERNARAQAQLVEDLLDVSRIITGKLRLDVRPVDLVAVIEAAIDSVRPAAQAKAIRLVSTLDPRAGVVAGDSDRLQQIAWNLLSNAIKYTPRDGRVDVGLEPGEHAAVMTVRDTGQGIAPAFLPYVFERFRQGQPPPGGQPRGLGLGLAIVRHLVELHGGTVEAASDGEGRGATFTVTIPTVPVAPHAAPATGHRPLAVRDLPSLADVTVLVVDDDLDTRELLRAILSQCGAAVVSAASAGEALAFLAHGRADVLVSDLAMPGDDGLALMRKIRAGADGVAARIPAIALTAYARAQDRTAALLSGFQAHVPKPTDPHELTVVIATLLGRLGREP